MWESYGTVTISENMLHQTKSNGVFRSSSASDVFTAATETPPPNVKIEAHSILNLQPQDFVVSSGQTYRIKRSPRALGNGDIGRQSPVNVAAYSLDNPTHEQAKVRMLLKALDEANRKITEQNDEIARNRQHIVSLEKELGREPSYVIPDDSFTVFSDLMQSLPASTASIPDSGSSCHTMATPRSRSKIHSAIITEKQIAHRTSPPSMPHPINTAPDAGEDVLLTQGEIVSPLLTGKESRTPKPDGGIVVSPLSVEDHLSSLLTSETPMVDSDATQFGDITHVPRGPRGSRGKALAARLSLSTRDRRKQQKVAIVDSAEALGLCDKSNGMKRRPFHAFLSKGATEGESPTSATETFYASNLYNVISDNSLGPYLYIAHDNPQLGKSVYEAIRSGGSSAVPQVMLESKDSNGLTCFILGNTVYSGHTEGIVHDKSDPESGVFADVAASRGSQCLVCHSLRAFRFKLESASMRLRGMITEINMLGESSEVQLHRTSKSPRAGASLAKAEVDITSPTKLAALLEQCTSRVDIILAPHHSDSWYPYWETEEISDSSNLPPPGSRKLAPQFRSNGVGYLRLGDDMSRFGTSFLSIDGLKTYLDNSESTNIVLAEPINRVGVCNKLPLSAYLGSVAGNVDASRLKVEAGLASLGVASPKNSHRRRKLSTGSSDRSVGSNTSTGSAQHSQTNSADFGNDFAGAIDVTGSVGSRATLPTQIDIHSVVDDLSVPTPAPLLVGSVVEDGDACAEPGLKWSDRVGLLQKVHTFLELSAETIDAPHSLLTRIARVIQQHMLKQKNPLVLKEAVGCAGSFGRLWQKYPGQDRDGVLLTPWTEVLVGTAQLMRHANRGVADAAKTTMSSLAPVGSDDVILAMTVFVCVSDNIDRLLSGAVKNAVGTGTSKVIQWLAAIITDYTAARQQESLMVFSTANLKREDKAVVSIVDRAFSLLGHREEAVREGAVVLLAQLFTLDVAIHRPPRPPIEKSASASSSPVPVQSEGRCRSLSQEMASSPRQSAVVRDGPDELKVDPLVADTQILARSLSPAVAKSLLEYLTSSSAVATSSHVNSKVVRLSNEYIDKIFAGIKVTPSDNAPLSVAARADRKALSSLTDKRRAGKLRMTTRRKSGAGSRIDREVIIATPQDTSQLSGMFFEAQLILRNPSLSSREVWDEFSQVSGMIRKACLCLCMIFLTFTAIKCDFKFRRWSRLLPSLTPSEAQPCNLTSPPGCSCDKSCPSTKIPPRTIRAQGATIPVHCRKR